MSNLRAHKEVVPQIRFGLVSPCIEPPVSGGRAAQVGVRGGPTRDGSKATWSDATVPQLPRGSALTPVRPPQPQAAPAHHLVRPKPQPATVHLMPRGKRIAQQVQLAIRRPDLLMRKLRRLEVSHLSIDEIAPFLPSHPVIVEAGAADGRDTAAFARRWPGCEIHAFEPVPQAFRVVEQATEGLLEVRLYAKALAHTDGVMTMHLSSHGRDDTRTDSSSLLVPTGHLDEFPSVSFHRSVDVPTITLDTWAVEVGVDYVDLMWLDMQGGELAALKAGSRILAATRAVMMEVSRTSLYAGAPLYAEVLAWMDQQGFAVAIDRVAVAFGNVLFVRR